MKRAGLFLLFILCHFLSCEECREKTIVDSYTGRVSVILCGLEPWAVCPEEHCSHNWPGYVNSWKRTLGPKCIPFTSYHCTVNQCSPLSIIESAFIRDNFLAYTTSDGGHHLVGHKGLNQEYVEEVINLPEIATVEISRFNFEGGNIKVGASFVIVSKDILIQNLADTLLMHELVKLPCRHRSDSVKIIEDSMSKELFNDRKIIWYGSEQHFLCDTYIDYCTTMPLYHLDMCIAIAGKDENSDSLVVFTADTADFDVYSCSGDTSSLAKGPCDSVVGRYLATCNDSLRNDFEKIGIKIKFIQIPIIWDYVEYVYYSFLNGIVENYGTFRLFHTPPMPDFLCPSSRDSLIDRFRDNGVPSQTKFLFAQDAYVNKGGLHCMTLELERTKD